MSQLLVLPGAGPPPAKCARWWSFWTPHTWQAWRWCNIVECGDGKFYEIRLGVKSCALCRAERVRKKCLRVVGHGEANRLINSYPPDYIDKIAK